MNIVNFNLLIPLEGTSFELFGISGISISSH